jgi:hypothetical protein
MKIKKFNDNVENIDYQYIIEIRMNQWNSHYIYGNEDKYEPEFDNQNLEEVVEYYLESKNGSHHHDVRILKAIQEDITETKKVKTLIEKIKMGKDSDKYNL